MSDHPVLACYRGLDSADAVQLGALLAKALDEPIMLAHACWPPSSWSSPAPSR